MILAAHMGSDRGVSFKEGSGIHSTLAPELSILSSFKNPGSDSVAGIQTRLLHHNPPNFDPTTVIMIGSIDVKKDHRELETCSGPCASKGRSSDHWMPAKRVQAVDIKRLSDTAVEITPSAGLQAGQYMLVGSPLVGYFDFVVKRDTPAQ